MNSFKAVNKILRRNGYGVVTNSSGRHLLGSERLGTLVGLSSVYRSQDGPHVLVRIDGQKQARSFAPSFWKLMPESTKELRLIRKRIVKARS